MFLILLLSLTLARDFSNRKRIPREERTKPNFPRSPPHNQNIPSTEELRKKYPSLNLNRNSEIFTNVMSLFTNDPKSPTSRAYLSLSEDRSLAKTRFRFVDCIRNEKFCENEDISTFPTVNYLLDDELFDYYWAHTFDDYYEFVVKMNEEDVREVNTTDQYSDLSSKSVAFILYSNPEDSLFEKHSQDFKQIANEYKASHVYFGLCQTEEISQIRGIEKKDFPLLVKLGVDEQYLYNLTGDINSNRMKEFISKHKCPMKLEVTESYYQEALECFSDKIVFFSFYEDELAEDYNLRHISSLIQSLRLDNDWRFQFSSVNISKFNKLSSDFSIKNTPSFIIADYRSGIRYVEVPKIDLKDTESLKIILEKAWGGEDLSAYGIRRFLVLKKGKNDEYQRPKAKEKDNKLKKNSKKEDL